MATPIIDPITGKQCIACRWHGPYLMQPCPEHALKVPPDPRDQEIAALRQQVAELQRDKQGTDALCAQGLRIAREEMDAARAERDAAVARVKGMEAALADKEKQRASYADIAAENMDQRDAMKARMKESEKLLRDARAVLDVLGNSSASLFARIEAFLANATPAAPDLDVLTDAAQDVLAERRRQIEKEGWTPEHDVGHNDDSLARAAACYAIPNAYLMARQNVFIQLWPWGHEWWKPSDRRRNLVKAGALILADIERLDRAKAGG